MRAYCKHLSSLGAIQRSNFLVLYQKERTKFSSNFQKTPTTISNLQLLIKIDEQTTTKAKMTAGFKFFSKFGVVALVTT
jgi:hypothetical protein